MKHALKGLGRLSQRLLALGALFGLASFALAAPPEGLKEKLQAALPAIQIASVAPSSLDCLWEVDAGPVVLYATADGRYVLSGDLIDVQQQLNLTEETRKKGRVKAVSALADRMLIYKAAQPKYVVTVFTDIDCSHCRRFHQSIEQINDLGITIRYVAFPRTGIPSKSYDKAVSVWCSEDPQVAMTRAKQGKFVSTKACDTHDIVKQYDLGVSLGVRGTPTLLFEDGSLHFGFLAPEDLLKLAAAHSA